MSNSTPSTSPTPVSETHDVNLLTVSAHDFGPIAQATVNLRPLTIFVGRSNTGKTYFSKLIYAIHKTLSGFPKIPIVSSRAYGVSHSLIKSLESLLNEIRDRPKTNDGQQEIRNFIFQYFEETETQQDKNDQILDEIGNCFGTTDILTTRRAHSKKNDFKINVSCRSASDDIWNMSIGSKKKKASVNTTFNSGAINLLDSAYNELISPIEHKVDSTSADSIEDPLGQIYIKFVYFILKLAYPDSHHHQESYFLPANRGGILESHKFIADAWLAQIPNLGLRRMPALHPLPKVSVDFMRTMLMTDDHSRTYTQAPIRGGSGPLEGVAKLIEDELIAGKLRSNTSTETSYPVFEYVPVHTKRSLRLDVASSMVSELAPIILIARSYLKPFDLLIIEEPEAHLYPGALPAVAKCLAKLVRNNVRVLITTHSDWLLKSLRNLILEGDLVHSGGSDQNSASDSYLLRNEVGAWEFFVSTDLGGTTVSEIEFDELDGIEPSEIERISDDLYNESVAIRNAKARRQQ